MSSILPSERPSLMSIRTTSLATSRQAITFAQVAPTAPAPTTVTLDIAFYFLCLAYQLFVIRGAQQCVVLGRVGHPDLDEPAFAVCVLVDDGGVGIHGVVEFEDLAADGQECVAHGF